MSALHNKINSYAIETGIQFNEPYQLAPTQTGTVTDTNASSWIIVGNAPTSELNVGPNNAGGSWRFNAANASCRLRTNTTNIVSRINDSDFSTGLWVKFNNIVPDSNGAYQVWLWAPTTTLGFSFIVSNNSTTGLNSLIFSNASTNNVSLDSSIDLNKWYYLAVRRSGTTWYVYLNGQEVFTETRSSSATSATALAFGAVPTATSTIDINVSNFYVTTASAIDATAISEIWTVGASINYSSEPLTASIEPVMPSNIIAIYRPETANGYLADTIVGYSPEHYYKLNENLTTGMSKPPIVNYGTVAVADGTVGSYFNVLPTLNSTGGLKGKGSWVFNYSSGTACPRISFSPQSTYLGDRNWSAGLFFKTNFTTPAITHDTAGYQLWYVGSTNRQVTVTFVGGTSSDANKGKLRFAVAGGSTFTTTARYDDQSWHYIAIRAILTGSTITYEFYIDGSLFTTTTVTDSSTTTGSYHLGDGTISTSINSTGNNTFELSDTYLAPYTTIAASQISQIWYAANNPPTPTPVNKTHQSEPLVVSTSTLLHPVITTVQGDHVESTTSFEISAIFPSPSFSTGDNVTVNVEVFENVNVTFGDNIFVETGADAIIPSTELTASALIVDPIVSRPAMTASAILPMPAIYVAPNYFTLVKNLNPLYYISDGQPTPTNNGSWTVNNYTVQYIDDNVSSGEEMSTVGTGKSWRANSNGIILNEPRLRGNITNYQSLVTNLYATREVSIEFWYYSIGRPRLPGLNYIESGAIFDDGITQITEVYDWWGCTGDAPLYRQVLIGGLTEATFGLENDPVSVSYRTYENGEPAFDDWNHVVVTYEPVASATQIRQKVYLNGSIIYNSILNMANTFGPDTIDVDLTNSLTFTGPTIGHSINITGGQQIKLNDNVRVDEVAIYPITLSSTQVSEHYSFIKSLSPDENVFAPVIEPSAQMGNHLVIAQDNFIYEDTPGTATGIVVQPTVIAGVSIDHVAQTMTADAELVNPALSLGITITAEINTVYAEMNPAFALSSIYYDYIQANIAPYRYVTFDDANPYLDFGSDDDYAVAPVVVGGTIVNPGTGINGKSAKTTGMNYATDGVILKESVHDDDWGVSGNHYSTAFWMQRAADDTSTGLRVLANAYGYGTGDYFLLYHYQNKLHFEFKNSNTLITQTSANNVNIFDFGTHFIAIDIDHSGQFDTAKIYVDAVLVMTIELGTERISLINGVPHSAPNDEANNYPRYSVGCLITPFAQTALPVVPTNTKLIIDEIFWDKNSISLVQVAAVYNMMPGKTNVVQTPLSYEVSALFVMPTISTNVNISSDAQLASAELLDPALYVVKNNDFTADFMSADATMPGAARRDNVNINAEFMLASCSIGGAGTPRLVDAATCTANIELVDRRVIPGGIRVNNFATYTAASAWVTYVKIQNETNIVPTGNVR